MSALELELEVRLGDFCLAVPSVSVARPTAVIGPNGAGKTTLLLAILGALRPLRGRIAIGGELLADAGLGVEVPLEDRGLGYVPQQYALFPHLTALENVAFGLGRSPRRERRPRALSVMERLGISRLAARRPSQLSGGERQRVALARALAPGARALLLDEPLAALDPASRRELRTWLGATLRELSVPALVVTHDLEDAEALADDALVLERGRLSQAGTLSALAAAPASDFSRSFFAAAGRPGATGPRWS